MNFVMPKGRLMKKAAKLLKQIDIEIKEPEDRELIVRDDNFSWIYSRVFDVPVFVENGIDMGIAGSDVIDELESDVFIPLDLPFGQCRLSVITPVDRELRIEQMNNYRIATKFPNITKKFFTSAGIDVNVIKLHGSMELAPKTAVADAIVDIVDSGNTIKANGLKEIYKIQDVGARLIVNRVSQKTKFYEINELIDQLSGIL
ncbi:MAG TPA: ATP phosphoribosyltransferase [Thermotogota bacterium]|nr:ATP phosphoribosyltransferase [Thermotogota bacterium]HPJ89812.1 ATP phosphoribosyltransferase [Thermotogota bacterium]HPR96975.1 ATP phosphoribosyltransferase [Thermotogota bacterium]